MDSDDDNENLQDYKILGFLGRGTYGMVYEAIHRETQEHVAIKKNYSQKYTQKEIEILQKLQNMPNIIKLLDTRMVNSTIYLMFEIMDRNLETVIMDMETPLPLAHIKTYMKMLLTAVASCHKNQILHRDLKPNNFLLNNKGEIKLIDFGMSCIFHPDEPKSPQVITRYYRPPEIIFGEKQYSYSADMWSIGCIFAELLLREPYLQGASDLDQLGKIFSALGTPEKMGWTVSKFDVLGDSVLYCFVNYQEAFKLPGYLEFNVPSPAPLQEQFQSLDQPGIDLLSRLLQLAPHQRINAEEALLHEFFQCEPHPTDPFDLPRSNPPEKKRKLTSRRMFQ